MLPIENRIFHVRKWLLYLITTISFMPSLALFMSEEKTNVFIIVLGVEIAINFILYRLLNRVTITIDDQGITHRAVF